MSSSIIETTPIEGFNVYGLPMVEYTVNGNTGQDYLTAVLNASLAESIAIESEARAFSAVVRARRKKLEELGTALAVLTKAEQSLTHNSPESSDLSEANDALKTAQAYMNKYGLTLNLTDGNRIRRDNVMTGRNNLQYALDTEDNDLQQDMISLQGLMSKRNNAFSTASKLMTRINKTSTSILNNIGN